MKVLKILLLLAVLVFTFSLAAFAAEDTYRASVEKLLVLTKQDQIVDQIFTEMKQIQMQQLQQMNIPPENYPIIEKYFGKIYDLMKAEMGWDKIKDDFIQLYMSVYTEDEIGGLVNFYESKLGEKTMAKMPQLTQQAMLISQKYVARITPQIQTLAQEMAAEIRASKGVNEEPAQ